MKVTDIITITELSRIMNKSRPTLYKYLFDYEREEYDDIPNIVKDLFDSIVNKNFSKKDIYIYCDTYFNKDDDLSEIVSFIKENKSKLDLNKVMNFLRNEVK